MFWSVLSVTFEALQQALSGLLLPFIFFAGLALAVKGSRAISDARTALPESRTTLLLVLFNAVFVVPAVSWISAWLEWLFSTYNLSILPPDFWLTLHPMVVIVVAVFVGDFAGYWRHRLEHAPLLWPSHAVHHSDTEMTWFSLERFHPINRLTTVIIDSSALLALGVPLYAVIANNLVRHYYGYFIHADLPWTYGFLGKIFVSPSMHRWHHCADEEAYNTNFATVFSVFDQAFGTYRVPGPCLESLGVKDDMGTGASGQLAYPFRTTSYAGLLRKNALPAQSKQRQTT